MSLIGYIDEPVTPDAAVDALISKVGGTAVIFDGRSISLQCQLCNNRCKLVCQIYCPVDDPYHRTIYIFSCTALSCHRTSQGWKVLRILTPVSASSTKVASNDKLKISNPVTADRNDSGTADDWGESAADDWGESAADDWGESEADDWSNGVEKTQHKILTNKNSHASAGQTHQARDNSDLLTAIDGVTVNSTGESYDPYYISVVEDGENSVASDKLTKHGKQLLEAYERQAEKLEICKGGAGRHPASEHYERSSIAHGDRLFYKFSKTVSKSPSQIIRYDYGGKALPMISLELANIPSCENCGAQRIYELQLMPMLLQSLKSQGTPSPLDVGTVIVFSCSKNCWDGRALLECPIVQHDPDEHLIERQLKGHCMQTNYSQ